MTTPIATQLDHLYRADSGRILATLVGLLGDLDRAEEAMHEAFRVALERWPVEGTPRNPASWLISTARHKAIDRLRRTRRETPIEGAPEPAEPPAPDASSEESWPDERLRLVFTCCHPAIPVEARVALTLREICGLTTEEIARAFLTEPAALAQRVVRAKAKIRDEAIPYEIPAAADLPARLDAVLRVIYLVFNEGYSASAGSSLTRPALSEEAIRLGRLLAELLPEPEVLGLLALMLLNESRRAARVTADGDIVLLEDQDRSRWIRPLITEGLALVERTRGLRRPGPYQVQAAIAATHAQAASAQETNWDLIVALYSLLLQLSPSPVIELNRAVAIAMKDGPEAGLALVDDLLARGVIDRYRWTYSVRADLLRRLGRRDEALAAYREALERTEQAPERRFLEKRIQELV